LQAPAVALNQAILAAISGGLQTLFDCHFASVCGFVLDREALRNLLIYKVFCYFRQKKAGVLPRPQIAIDSN